MGLDGSPVKPMGQNKYSFMHKSYQEFFAAKSLFQEIMDSWSLLQFPEENQQKIKLLSSIELNKKIVNAEPSIVRFMADQVSLKGASQTVAKLMRLVKHSAIDKKFATAAANIMTTLNAVPGRCYEGEDFSGVNICGANLIGFQAQYSNFEGATLENVEIAKADLRNANFNNATLKNVNFGEYAQIGRAHV